MKRVRCAVVAFLLTATLTASLNAGVTLDFNAPVPGTLTDSHGLGTGFTTRLLQTGSAIPINDPNLDLLTSPGHLLITSTKADINNGGTNLAGLEMPGVFISGVGSADLSVSAVFENVHLPNGSDQLTVYAAADAHTIVRAGLHEQQVYIISPNNGGGDMNVFSPHNSWTPGDTIEVTLARQSGMWSLSWDNLTAASSGSLPAVSLPWLDSQPDLYFGILAANAGTNSSFIGQVDRFSVNVVPEPASVVVWGLLALPFTAAVRWRYCPRGRAVCRLQSLPASGQRPLS